MSRPAPRPRLRDHGLTIGTLPVGPANAITDVDGVRVGQVTRWVDDVDADGSPIVGRTGVTAVVPAPLDELFAEPMVGGVSVLNGAGELTGSIELAEWGLLETPILLTGTSSVGRAYDAVVDAVFEAVPTAGIDDFVIPVVGECDDSWLDQARRRFVTVADARAALDAAQDEPAGHAVAEGSVGGGTGMITMGCKAGIGTSSRLLPLTGFTLGVLVMTNFGSLGQLRVAGRSVGARLMREWGEPTSRSSPRNDAGSCIGVVATDAPLDAHQLGRLVRRVGLGLARVGGVAHHGSGDIFCGFTTGTRRPRNDTGVSTSARLGDHALNQLFQATVDAAEEAVLNALFVADTVVGRDGNTARGLPVESVLALL